MGSVTKAIKKIASFTLAGAATKALIGEDKKKSSVNKAMLAQGLATASLQKEARDTSKQRQALFATEGGILGEEVEGVGRKKRGTILGN